MLRLFVIVGSSFLILFGATGRLCFVIVAFPGYFPQIYTDNFSKL